MKAAISFRTLTAVVVVLAGAMIASGSSITSIGVLNPGEGGTPESAVKAITADGSYAVGYSNGTATILDIAGNPTTFAGQVPVVWKAETATLYQLPMTADSFGLGRAANTMATGVVVRSGTEQIAIGGGFLQAIDPFKWQMCSYKAQLANPAGGTWSDNTLSGPLAGIIAPYNSVRMRTTMSGDAWFVSGDRSGNYRDFNMGMDGTSSYEHQGHLLDGVTWDCVANTVNGAGRSAGHIKRSNGAADPLTNPRRATYLNGVNSNVQTPIPGGSQFDSDAIGISPDPNNIILCGVDFSDVSNSKAFIWKPADAAMTLLNPLAGDTLAGAVDVRLIGGYAITAGYSSNGTTENAVIWDTTGAWDSTGQAVLVKTLLSNDGVDVSAWTSLTRITSMSDDGTTVAGYGIWAADGSTRGFVAKKLFVPPSRLTSMSARKLFYNNSYYDNNGAGIDTGTGTKSDNAAVDAGGLVGGVTYPAKTPLVVVPGSPQAATFANWTGYTKGINGLIYEVLVGDGQRDPLASDFAFVNAGKSAVGTTVVTPNNSASIVLVAGDPVNQRKVRLYFTFADGSLVTTWLKVTVGMGFGLAANEVHYWGNAPGETGSGNVSPNITVAPADEIAIKLHPTTTFSRSKVWDPFDITKNSLAEPADQIYVRTHGTTSFTCLKFITK